MDLYSLQTLSSFIAMIFSVNATKIVANYISDGLYLLAVTREGKSPTYGLKLVRIQLISELHQLMVDNQSLVLGDAIPPCQGELFLLEDVTFLTEESHIIR
jgi:hypothetical protein